MAGRGLTRPAAWQNYPGTVRLVAQAAAAKPRPRPGNLNHCAPTAAVSLSLGETRRRWPVRVTTSKLPSRSSASASSEPQIMVKSEAPSEPPGPGWRATANRSDLRNGLGPWERSCSRPPVRGVISAAAPNLRGPQKPVIFRVHAVSRSCVRDPDNKNEPFDRPPAMLSRTIYLAAALSFLAPVHSFHSGAATQWQPTLRRPVLQRPGARAVRSRTDVRMNLFGDVFQNAMLKLVEVNFSQHLCGDIFLITITYSGQGKGLHKEKTATMPVL